MFPLYWSSNYVSIVGFDYEKPSESEKDGVDLFQQLYVLNVRNLMDVRGNPMELDEYYNKFILCFFHLFLYYNFCLITLMSHFMYKGCILFLLRKGKRI